MEFRRRPGPRRRGSTARDLSPPKRVVFSADRMAWSWLAKLVRQQSVRARCGRSLTVHQVRPKCRFKGSLQTFERLPFPRRPGMIRPCSPCFTPRPTALSNVSTTASNRCCKAASSSVAKTSKQPSDAASSSTTPNYLSQL